MIDDFVRPRIRSAGRGTQSQVIQAVRGVLRHLQRCGRLAHDWSRLIQGGPRRYRLASVPTTIKCRRCPPTARQRQSWVLLRVWRLCSTSG
jgi:hypothetical protein